MIENGKLQKTKWQSFNPGQTQTNPKQNHKGQRHTLRIFPLIVPFPPPGFPNINMKWLSSSGCSADREDIALTLHRACAWDIARRDTTEDLASSIIFFDDNSDDEFRKVPMEDTNENTICVVFCRILLQNS